MSTLITLTPKKSSLSPNEIYAMIYALKNNELNEIHEHPFKLERDIQNIFEANLTQIMGLILVKSEFSIKDKRIDTLAYDQESKAFVIIEYKRHRNDSMIDQGFAISH